MDKNNRFLDSRVGLKRPRSSDGHASVLYCNRTKLKICLSTESLWAVKEKSCQSLVRIWLARVTKLSLYL